MLIYKSLIRWLSTAQPISYAGGLLKAELGLLKAGSGILSLGQAWACSFLRLDRESQRLAGSGLPVAGSGFPKAG